jgi:hypothetical protein
MLLVACEAIVPSVYKTGNTKWGNNDNDDRVINSASDLAASRLYADGDWLCHICVIFIFAKSSYGPKLVIGRRN